MGARQSFTLSNRKSCKILGINRNLPSYIKRKKDDEDKLRSDINTLATLYPSCGYTKVTKILCRDDGWRVNRKRVYRIWAEEKLQQPKRRKRQTKVYSNDGLCTSIKALYPNHVWSYDFVHDKTQKDGDYRILTIIDEATRKCLKVPIGRKFKSSDIIDTLSDLFISEGTPMYLRSDNGSEFTSKIVREFLARVGVKPLYIKPGSPWQNGINERFNGILRQECLNSVVFSTLKEAQVILDKYQVFYNTKRPHSSLDYNVPCPNVV